MRARAVRAALLSAFAISVCWGSVAAINEGHPIIGAGERHRAKPNIVAIAEEVFVSDGAINPQTCFASENLRPLVTTPFEYIKKLSIITSLNYGSRCDRVYYRLRNIWEFVDNLWYNAISKHFCRRSPVVIKSDINSWIFREFFGGRVNTVYLSNNEILRDNDWQLNTYDGFCLEHCSVGEFPGHIKQAGGIYCKDNSKNCNYRICPFDACKEAFTFLILALCCGGLVAFGGWSIIQWERQRERGEPAVYWCVIGITFNAVGLLGFWLGPE